MTKKAFLFDMDGVLADTEPEWAHQKQIIYTRLLGPDITRRLGDTRGISMDGIYDKAHALGATIPRTDFVAAHLQVAPAIYDTAPILDGAQKLATSLQELGYTLAIVSSSPGDWTSRVVCRLPFMDNLQLVLSLNDMDIPQKPAPDGYIYAMRSLDAVPDSTIILEDSNSGIAAATASGAFTIAFDGLLTPGYDQLPADAVAHTVDDVLRIVAKRTGGL